MSFKATLERYKANNSEAIAHEELYLHKKKGTIYQRRRSYFIEKKVTLEKKLLFWGQEKLYHYNGRRSYKIQDEIVILPFKLTSSISDTEEIKSLIEWKTNSTVISIQVREQLIGVLGS